MTVGDQHLLDIRRHSFQQKVHPTLFSTAIASLVLQFIRHIGLDLNSLKRCRLLPVRIMHLSLASGEIPPSAGHTRQISHHWAAKMYPITKLQRTRHARQFWEFGFGVARSPFSQDWGIIPTPHPPPPTSGRRAPLES